MWLIKLTLLVCMYVPAAVIAFSNTYYFSDDRAVFFFTFPGEWFAQRMGARAYDYYWVAAAATIALFHLGLLASLKGWFPFAMAALTVLGWSIFTMHWVSGRLFAL